MFPYRLKEEQKCLCWFLTLVILLGCTMSAVAESIDLTGMSYDELVALKDKINLAIWNSEQWQEVTVPQGVWKGGEDIPAGTWTARCADADRNSVSLGNCKLYWGEKLDADGQSIKFQGRYDYERIYNPNNRFYDKGSLTEYTFTVVDGDCIIIDGSYNKAVFTPYAGKPSLGFK